MGEVPETTETVGYAVAAGGALIEGKQILIRAITSAKALRSTQQLNLDQLVARIRTMPDAEFAELCTALRANKAFRVLAGAFLQTPHHLLPGWPAW